jgi:hypothetical protein
MPRLWVVVGVASRKVIEMCPDWLIDAWLLSVRETTNAGSNQMISS